MSQLLFSKPAGHALMRGQVRLVGSPPLPVSTHLLFLFLFQVLCGYIHMDKRTYTHTHGYSQPVHCVSPLRGQQEPGGAPHDYLKKHTLI